MPESKVPQDYEQSARFLNGIHVVAGVTILAIGTTIYLTNDEKTILLDNDEAKIAQGRMMENVLWAHIDPSNIDQTQTEIKDFPDTTAQIDNSFVAGGYALTFTMMACGAYLLAKRQIATCVSSFFCDNSKTQGLKSNVKNKNLKGPRLV